MLILPLETLLGFGFFLSDGSDFGLVFWLFVDFVNAITLA
jgi:hypothetical protein|tara:strand:- start:156 stop:275 length:120 start_codon:yes stop_codon:yes gene_type:complete